MAHIEDFIGKRVHFSGIGGSSMSGLAGLLHERGYRITGSDQTASYATEALEALGIPVRIGHDAENVHGADLVVYTAAIAADNPERLACQALGIPTLERAVLLGQLCQGHEEAIAVCGTHGKTTTTAMLAAAMLACGTDPTIHIGGNVDFLNGSTHIGSTDYFLCEACEFNASFLHLAPTLALVLNIDADHLDYYRDIDHIQETFLTFLQKIPPTGTAVGCGDDARVRDTLSSLSCRHLTYGHEAHNDWRVENLDLSDRGRARFTATFQGKPMAEIALLVPGAYNALNALGALACCHALGLDIAAAAKALGAFENAHRRFELTGTRNGMLLYHDYGHNPTEMRNVLATAKMQPHNRLIAVVQPHTYSRVRSLLAQYGDFARDADIILVTDIYAAREKDPGDVHTSQILAEMKKHGLSPVYTPDFAACKAWLIKHGQPGDLVLTLGCGNINLLNDYMLVEND